MLSRFMPREEKFFELFRQSGELMVEGAKVLHQLFADIKNAPEYAKKLKDI